MCKYVSKQKSEEQNQALNFLPLLHFCPGGVQKELPILPSQAAKVSFFYNLVLYFLIF